MSAFNLLARRFGIDELRDRGEDENGAKARDHSSLPNRAQQSSAHIRAFSSREPESTSLENALALRAKAS
jgi:hypothetical protein